MQPTSKDCLPPINSAVTSCQQQKPLRLQPIAGLTMTAYLPSMKWPSLRSQPALAATDFPLDKLPQHESEALATLRSTSTTMIEVAARTLPEIDGWRCLNDEDFATLRDEILLRFLRYNALSVEKSQEQFGKTLQWRSQGSVSTLPLEVMRGCDAGLPLCILYGPTESGDMLFFSLAEAYIRKEIDHAKQAVAIGKMFDHLLYDKDGPRGKRGSIVIDFTNMSVKNVDLIGLRAGIMIYLNYFPDLFYKILFINYPKFIYGGKSTRNIFSVFHPIPRCTSCGQRMHF